MPGTRSINTKELPLSLIDDLTQLCNRRFIYNNMPKIIVQEGALAKKISLFMLDIDNFKKVNDTFGHLAGDKLLVGLVRMMEKHVADKGIIARYAGDEFLILLPEQDEKEAHEFGQAMLEDLAKFKWSAGNRHFIGQGVSMGIAVYPEDSASLTELINCADQALYAAKRAGKNKILLYKAVTGEIKNRLRLRQALLRPSLVDRKEELGDLKEQYEKFHKGTSRQGMLVEGESGIGKTRLLEEFAGWVRGKNVLFLFCKLEKKEEGGPLAALAELFRLVKNSVDADRLGDSLTKLTPPELAEILYLYPAAKKLVKSALYKIKPGKRASNLFSGLHKILVDIAGGDALILVVDDLDYANQIALQFFSTLLEAPGVSKFLFAGAYGKENESEILNEFLSEHPFTTLKLRPLTIDEARQMVTSIFPGIKLAPKPVENIFKTCKGNPLLLCKILTALVEAGHIKYEDEQWSLEDVDIKDIPDSLESAAKSTLDTLDGETKEMLSTAAVMGEKVELDILKDLSGYNEGYLMELLDRATNAGLIKSPDLSYDSLSFQTESARKTLADMVPPQKANLIHQKLAELIKQYYKNELPTQLDRLIYHLDLAKDKDSSLKYKDLDQKVNSELSLPKRLTDILEKIEEQKEAAVSIEELLEKPLSEASTKIIKDAILALRAATIGTLLYPVGNSTRVDLENKAYGIMLKIFKNDPTLTISSVEGKVLVNGYAPKHMDVKNAIGFTLASLMEDYGINSITFKRDLSMEEFKAFLYYIANPEEEIRQHEKLASLLEKKGVSNIKIDQVRYEKLSDLTKKAIGAKSIKGEGPLVSGLTKDNLLYMPVERYTDPDTLGKIGLIAEALLLSKNDGKMKELINKFSGDLNAVAAGDESAVTEGAIQLSESLLAYEKFSLLEPLVKALLNRVNNVQQTKEFTQLCEGLQTIAVRMIERKDFDEAGLIINRLKEQAAADSPRTQEQKNIAEAELHKIAHPEIIESLITAFKKKLKSNDYADITDVLEALGEYALTPMLNFLTQEEIDKKDPFDLYVMRHSVAMILKKIGQPAKDALKNMLMDRRPYVVKNVIETLSDIGSEEFVPLLASFMRAASPQIRMQCVIALRKIGTAESLKSLTEGLKDEDEDIKQAAGLAIIKLADQSFIKELEPLLSDESTKNIARKIIQKLQAKKE